MMRPARRQSRRETPVRRNHFPLRAAALLAWAMIGVILFLAVTGTASGKRPDPETWRLDMLRRLNAIRAQHGLTGLRLDNRLNKAAQLHTNNMIHRDFFDHKDPDGAKMTERADAFGYRWRWIIENIAAGQPNMHEALNGWMASPDHRAAILDERVRDAGIGYSYAPNDWGSVTKIHYWTLLVGSE